MSSLKIIISSLFIASFMGVFLWLISPAHAAKLCTPVQIFMKLAAHEDANVETLREEKLVQVAAAAIDKYGPLKDAFTVPYIIIVKRDKSFNATILFVNRFDNVCDQRKITKTSLRKALQSGKST